MYGTSVRSLTDYKMQRKDLIIARIESIYM